MQINIKIEKHHFYILLTLCTLLALGILAVAQSTNVDITKPWHPLRQIAKSDTNMASVDANNNGIIDMAESISGLTSKCTLVANTNKAEKKKMYVDLPSYCKASLCLILAQVVKGDTNATDTPSSGKVADMQIEFYFQVEGDSDDPTSVERWETIGSIIGAGKNGDGAEKAIAQLKLSETLALQLLDDLKGKEEDANKWTYNDVSNKYGGRVFVCQL